MPHVLQYVDGPVYGTALTLAFVEPKLDELGDSAKGRLKRVRPRDRVSVGSFTIEFLRVTHSMPDCVALAIETPQGVVVHTGDFKIDQTPPDGEPLDFHRLARSELRRLALPPTAPTSEQRLTAPNRRHRCLRRDLHERHRKRRRDVSSSLYRMQIVVDLAAQFERRVAFVGRGVVENSEIAQRLGYLRTPAGMQIRDSDVRNYPAQDVVCVCTGTQGEPRAALSRIAINDHRHVVLDADDVVVFSAREIPGNEKANRSSYESIARPGQRSSRWHHERPRIGARKREE